MAEKSFSDALNEQIANEFAASQQYVGMAVYYDAETLPRLAAFFYRQALEEREHAMMMIRYLLDVGEKVRIPDIKAQQTSFDDGAAPVRMALQQEQRVSDEIFGLFELARELKETLPSLRDGAAGPELAEMAREVLNGDVDIRNVARSSVYADQLTRAIGLYQRWHEQLTPQEREQLLTDTRRHIRDRWTQES